MTMKRLGDLLPALPPVIGGSPEPEEGECLTCAGAGFLRTGLPPTDRHFGEIVVCPTCLPQRMTEARERWIALSRLPLVSRRTRTFDTWQERRGLTDALSAAKKFSTAKTRHRSLTLAGGSGVGKTHLAFAIAWAWLEVPWGTVRYWQAERLLDELRRGYSREEGREDTYALLDQAMGCSLLILDDLGAHKQGDWATAKLDEIVDTRYAHARHMVVTTNDPAKLPERIQDRLLEGVTIGIPASVSSWRRSPDVRGKLEAR